MSTVTYWTSKLLPTLLVVYDASADRFFYGWLHDIVSPGAVFERQGKGHKRMRLRMSAKGLTKSAWQEIRSEAASAHEAVRASVDHAPVRSYYHVLYCLAADVTDLLVDVVTGIAYASPFHLAMQFGDPDPDRLASLAEKFVAEMPAQPAAALHREHVFIVMQLQALDHEFQAFLFGKFMFHKDNPIVRATESIQRTLRGLIDEILPEAYGPEPTSNKPALRAARLDIVKLVYGVGLILCSCGTTSASCDRSSSRSGANSNGLRPLRGNMRHLSTRMVRDISDELVTSFASWRVPAHTGD